jgi:hypothetical protein
MYRTDPKNKNKRSKRANLSPSYVTKKYNFKEVFFGGG